MKSAGGRVPINGTRSEALRSELGVPFRCVTVALPSPHTAPHHLKALPDISTLSRLQKTLEVVIPFRGSKGPLHLLVDSTGNKVEGEGEWHTRKHGGSKQRVWRKIHLGIDEETLEIRAVEVTSSNVSDVEPVNATGSNEPARDAAGPTCPDPGGRGDRHDHGRRRLRHAGLTSATTLS